MKYILVIELLLTVSPTVVNTAGIAFTEAHVHMRHVHHLVCSCLVALAFIYKHSE